MSIEGAGGERLQVFSPPKFSFTPEPVCSLYRKKATTIGPLFRPSVHAV
jgi:hypothetical protein